MSFSQILKLRYLFIILLVVGINLVKHIKYQEIYQGTFDYIKKDPLDLIVDIFTIYYLVIGSIYMMRWWYHERKAQDFVYLQIIVPRSDSKKDYEQRQEKDFKEKIGVMVQFFRALTELSEMNLKNIIRTKLWDFEKISFEILMEEKNLKFIIVCDEYFQSIIEKQVTSFFPSADIQAVEDYEIKRPGYKYNGYYIHTKNDFWYPIKTFQEMENDPMNDLANVFSKLEEDEKAVMQLIVNPIPDHAWRKEATQKASDFFMKKKNFHIPIISDFPIIGMLFNVIGAILIPGKESSLSSSAPGADSGDHYIRMLQPQEELAKRMGTKAGQMGFDVSIRVMASAKTSERVEEILNNLVVGMTIYKDALGNWFENRRIIPFDPINAPLILHGFKRRLCKFYIGKTSLLVPNELATVFHFPDAKYNPIPIIKWLDYKVLAPPSNIPKDGTLLGTNSFRGQKTNIFMTRKDRSRHHYILGKSGSGKSVMLSYMARQDVINGDGLCVIDPHGDLIEDILAFVPKERAKDVIVFDPANIDRPMGLNLLEAKTSEQKDRASLDAMNIFLKLFGNEIFGPRLQHYFRNGCLTLMDDEEAGATIIDVPRLFTDDEFQKYKVAKCKNTVVKQFWDNEMAKTGQREKEEMIPYFSSKFGPFISNTTMRNVIGQPKSAFNIRQVMDEGKILLVNLSKGKIGDLNAQLLGLIFVNKISMAAMSRADIPESERRDFYLYVDEFQNFATDAFADILSEARKYHLALIMAHQYIAQLNNTQGYEKQSKLRDAVFGNVGTMMSFKVGADDAEYLEKEYAPILSQQDILGISNYKAYVKLNINNATSRPFSLETIWDQAGANRKSAEIIKQYSRMKFGRKKIFVDQEIEDRLGIK
ncbi:MAG: type IV secretion system DNA-binding domain-containing protein [Candidatus Gracilibacteria bacterium]|jgi:hypothetical protein|nr:type IV secretion system DNA-binding domain-containing protein [Candidatus Gracilibacteria bacterium]